MEIVKSNNDYFSNICKDIQKLEKERSIIIRDMMKTNVLLSSLYLQTGNKVLLAVMDYYNTQVKDVLDDSIRDTDLLIKMQRDLQVCITNNNFKEFYSTWMFVFREAFDVLRDSSDSRATFVKKLYEAVDKATVTKAQPFNILQMPYFTDFYNFKNEVYTELYESIPRR